MTRPTFTIAAIAFLSSATAATSSPVTFESPCECRDNHGEHRWAVKNAMVFDPRNGFWLDDNEVPVSH
jgi:hypothetical protein